MSKYPNSFNLQLIVITERIYEPPPVSSKQESTTTTTTTKSSSQLQALSVAAQDDPPSEMQQISQALSNSSNSAMIRRTKTFTQQLQDILNERKSISGARHQSPQQQQQQQPPPLQPHHQQQQAPPVPPSYPPPQRHLSPPPPQHTPPPPPSIEQTSITPSTSTAKIPNIRDIIDVNNLNRMRKYYSTLDYLDATMVSSTAAVAAETTMMNAEANNNDLKIAVDNDAKNETESDFNGIDLDSQIYEFEDVRLKRLAAKTATINSNGSTTVVEQQTVEINAEINEIKSIQNNNNNSISDEFKVKINSFILIQTKFKHFYYKIKYLIFS